MFQRLGGLPAADPVRSTFGISVLIALLAGCGVRENGAVPAAAAHPAAVQMASSYQVLHRFGGADGAMPEGRLFVDRWLYGTTQTGGAYDRGTFYRITAATGEEKVLYSFGHGSDGAKPESGLAEANGVFYGTTQDGGTSHQGIVYSMRVLVRGVGEEAVLHNFTGNADGAFPFGRVVNVNGTLYGTTFTGGKFGEGTIYSITTSGTLTVLHSFAGGSDGAGSYSGLIEANGILYGTTASGGAGCPSLNAGGCGTVYSVSTAGVEKVLHSFTGGSDGAYPYAGLVDVNGTLYGTTINGGGACTSSDDGCGTVFSISPAGIETVLHRFDSSDGDTIYAGLTAVSGTLYGAASGGGTFGRGLVYSMSMAGAEKVLHTYRTDANGDGPNAAPIVVKGTLYGTTETGGGSGCKNFGGCGTVYALTP